MLFIFHGTDSEKTRARALFIFSEDEEKSKIRIESEDEETLSELLAERSLFGETKSYFLDDFGDLADFIKNNLHSLIRSENKIVAYFSDSISKDLEKNLLKEGAKIEEFMLPKTRSLRPFNTFSLADALGERDKKSLWILHQKSIKKDVTAEEACGVLFWQLKAIYLVLGGDGASLSPFVASKTKRFSRNFKKEEVAEMLSRLVALYHESHRGRSDFNRGLESFALSI